MGFEGMGIHFTRSDGARYCALYCASGVIRPELVARIIPGRLGVPGFTLDLFHREGSLFQSQNLFPYEITSPHAIPINGKATLAVIQSNLFDRPGFLNSPIPINVTSLATAVYEGGLSIDYNGRSYLRATHAREMIADFYRNPKDALQNPFPVNVATFLFGERLDPNCVPRYMSYLRFSCFPFDDSTEPLDQVALLLLALGCGQGSQFTINGNERYTAFLPMREVNAVIGDRVIEIGNIGL